MCSETSGGWPWKSSSLPRDTKIGSGETTLCLVSRAAWTNHKGQRAGAETAHKRGRGHTNMVWMSQEILAVEADTFDWLRCPIMFHMGIFSDYLLIF